MDPPDHTRLRTLVAKAFTMRGVEEPRPAVRAIADRLITDMIAAGPPADLVDLFALPLPVAVICELLGVPAEELEDLCVGILIAGHETTASQIPNFMLTLLDPPVRDRGRHGR